MVIFKHGVDVRHHGPCAYKWPVNLYTSDCSLLHGPLSLVSENLREIIDNDDGPLALAVSTTFHGQGDGFDSYGESSVTNIN